jgi:hypothetical protein
MVLVVVNRRTQPLRFDIEWNHQQVSTEIGGRSVATYRWQGSSD